MEREASGNPYSAKGAFLWPTIIQGGAHPSNRDGDGDGPDTHQRFSRPSSAAVAADVAAEQRRERPVAVTRRSAAGGEWSIF